MRNEHGILGEIEASYRNLHARILELRGADKPATVYSLHNGFSSDEDVSYQPIVGLRRMARHILSVLDVEPSQLVLDQGCGVGSIAFRVITENPSAKVVGSNISLTQLLYGNEVKRERTRRGENLKSLYFCGANYLENPFKDHTFDRVLFVDSISHSQDTEATICEASRVLKPGGKLVIFDFFALDQTDPEVESFRDLWFSPGLIGIDRLQETIKKNFSSFEITTLTQKILVSLKYMTEVRIPNLSPGSIERGGKLLYALVEKGKVGYFQLVAS